ncbi:porphobilinogen synthase [Pelagibacterium lacus]|uniref:Delta-aminolevulinic acid dehydratase n=1 Tax=Pelagibacterium lacus TaxID=2282655 RepID=A0A369W2T7_9HYPH|nr:porphobilinogen synthase [Pelagibacterium lacus]RDE08986.1 porphobilinogen synthase [Pelagibacterium lacus]
MTFEKHDMDFLAGRRLRRPRMAGWSRDLMRENTLVPGDLIWPIFVIEGQNERQEVKSMPGVERLSIDLAVEAAKAARAEGIPAMALFPNIDPSLRSEDGAEGINRDNLICRTLSAIKDAVPEIGLVADVALDPYTTHGHDGVMRGEEILNDESVAILVKQALVQAQSGADVIAPSDMMDGRVAAIRGALDDEGLEKTIILSYAAKYASAFYGPFRDAVGSGARLKGSKLTYQMDPANAEDAILEVEQDLAEGADWIMVKPGMPYLDVCRMVKDRFDVPVFAYQVSGEYAMIAFAAQAGAIDREAAMAESLMGFKRAGCSGILTYFALDMARKING